MAKNIIVGCDGSEQSTQAVSWACRRICQLRKAREEPTTKDDFLLHLVTVLPPMTYLMTPAAPIATPGAVAAVTHQWEAQKRADEAAAEATLVDAVKRCHAVGVGVGDQKDNVLTHILPAAGGASGVAASIVEFAKRFDDAVSVLGSRGYGAFTRSILNLVGLGSVGDFCTHNLTSPVVIIKQPSTPVEGEPLLGGAKVCVCVDDSREATNALHWALNTLVAPDSEVHVISVAPLVPMPVWPSMLDDAAIALASVSTRQWEDDKRKALANAEGCCANAIDIALKHGLKKHQLFWKALLPEGGASDVAESIAHYVRDNKMDCCVLGSHGYGAWKRSVMSMVGLGSVSEYCVHRLPCAVAVVKGCGKQSASDSLDSTATVDPVAPPAATVAEPAEATKDE